MSTFNLLNVFLLVSIFFNTFLFVIWKKSDWVNIFIKMVFFAMSFASAYLYLQQTTGALLK